MKRDMDLVRRLLFYIEENQENEPLQSGEINIDGHEEGAIGYHLKIMADGGLIDAQDITTFDSVSYDFFIRNITWYGHEFLDSVRDDGLWTRTKEALKPVGSASLSVVMNLAASLLNKQLGL